MDLEFLTPCIPVSLMFTNLNTSSYVGLYKEEGGLTSEGTHARKSTPLRPDYPRHHRCPSQSQPPSAACHNLKHSH